MSLLSIFVAPMPFDATGFNVNSLALCFFLSSFLKARDLNMNITVRIMNPCKCVLSKYVSETINQRL